MPVPKSGRSLGGAGRPPNVGHVDVMKRSITTYGTCGKSCLGSEPSPATTSPRAAATRPRPRFCRGVRFVSGSFVCGAPRRGRARAYMCVALRCWSYQRPRARFYRGRGSARPMRRWSALVFSILRFLELVKYPRADNKKIIGKCLHMWTRRRLIDPLPVASSRH